MKLSIPVPPASTRVACRREAGHRGVRLILERVMGFAPTAFSLARRRSTAELLPHYGATGGNWTPDARFFRPSLYH